MNEHALRKASESNITGENMTDTLFLVIDRIELFLKHYDREQFGISGDMNMKEADQFLRHKIMGVAFPDNKTEGGDITPEEIPHLIEVTLDILNEEKYK